MRKSWTLAVVFFVALATVSCSDDDGDDAPKVLGNYDFQDKKTNLSWGILYLDNTSSIGNAGDKIYMHSIDLYSEGLGTDGVSGKGSVVGFSLMTTETTLTPGTYVTMSGVRDGGVGYAYLQTDYSAADVDSGTTYGIEDAEVKVEGGTNDVYTITFSGKAYDKSNANSELINLAGTYSGKLTVAK
jgi:hypothetical protein